ncbi:MAG: radical SAM protein [Synergistaceae bacterium]|nr:radical SAM protein [Synergistaceae bacterium]
MYCLNSNVYLVPGKVNAAFYDFNHGRLVHINHDARKLLLRVLGHDDPPMTHEEREYLDRLDSLGLLTHEHTPPHEISELRENPAVDFVWVEVTASCNLKCIHCYNESDCNAGRVMPYEDFCYVIDELGAFGVRKIQLIGGEPLTLGGGITRYLDYLSGKFDYIEIFTNGTLLTESLTSYLRENGIRVALSLYSYDAGQHDRVTQVPGSWQKTNAAIRTLRDNGITYAVKNVLMKGVSLGERNTDLYTLNPMKDVVRLTGRASASLLTRELARKRLITRKSFQRRLSRGFVKRCLSGHNCFSRRLYIAADLTVYPCVMERRISHGNLRGHHLPGIINPQISAMNKDAVSACRECEFRYCCHDCRPDSNGMPIDSKPWYCTYDPHAGKWTDPEKFLDALNLCG